MYVLSRGDALHCRTGNAELPNHKRTSPRGKRDGGRAVYLDSSALVKMVVWEPESPALRRFLLRHPVRVSCALARTEVMRAVRPQGPEAGARAAELLRQVELVRIDDVLLDAAAALDPRILRSLDVLHLAAAASLSERTPSVVTYDERMAEGARVLGLPVAVPA